jgi:hypothetical protein
MIIYTVEVLSTVKTAILSCRCPKGDRDSHIVPGHEIGGCIEESRGHRDQKKRPGVDIFFKANSAGLTNLHNQEHV